MRRYAARARSDPARRFRRLRLVPAGRGEAGSVTVLKVVHLFRGAIDPRAIWRESYGRERQHDQQAPDQLHEP